MLQKILIANFSVWVKNKRTSINGNIEPLLSFFSPRAARIDLIDGPHPGSDQIISRIEIYQKGKLQKTFSAQSSSLLFPLLKIQNKNDTQVFFKIRDFLAVLEWGLRSREKFDLFIGLESIYALAGLILKKLGVVKTVVYYVSDYSPNRYQQRWLNQLYLWLDRFCCYQADFIWDVSKAMHPARIKAGLDPKKSAPEIHVPNALFPHQIKWLPLKLSNKKMLLYSGTLGLENGPDLAIKSLLIIKKTLPGVELHFTGDNVPANKSRLKKLAKKLKLENSIVFHGFVQDVNEYFKLIRSAYLGLAPYRAFSGSPRWYADSIKIRAYLGAGLPVVTTQVPPLGKEIAAAGAGLITRDNPQDFAQAVIKLLVDKKLYQKTRQAAIKYIKKNTWENTYQKALLKMNLL